MYWIDKVDERGCDGRLEVEEEEDVQVKEKKREEGKREGVDIDNRRVRDNNGG